jgi:hypothetical protein
MGKEQQGGVAGLIASANGVTLTLGPLAATAMYQVGVTLPFAFSVGLLGLLLAFCLKHPGMREQPALPAPSSEAEDDSANAEI